MRKKNERSHRLFSFSVTQIISQCVCLVLILHKKTNTKNHYFKKKYILISTFIVIFASEFKILTMEHKDLKRLKLMLVEKKRTGTWFAEQLGVTAVTASKWCSNVTLPSLMTLNKLRSCWSVN